MAGSEDRGPQARGRVLLVDDSRVVRVVVSGYLRSAGYDVEEAEDGVQALQRIEGASFDVVITDLKMPGVDGFGVLETVKRRTLGPEVIILTGSLAQDMSAAVRALRLGAHDFLAKPPSGPDEVVLTVERALEKKRLREANARLVKELEALTRTDALTGALNRRAFDEAIRQEVSRARRYDFPLAVLMLDIDHFKNINDTHGHRVGDEVLKFFAQLARMSLRESDAVHRYGGEEFVALLPHTPLAGALDAARRLVAATEATSFVIGDLRLNVTVSAGVACGHGAELETRDLLALADAALYDAKKLGRNRVVAAAEPGGPAPDPAPAPSIAPKTKRGSRG